MAFRWRADDGPILVVFGSTHNLKKRWSPSEKNFLDPHMQQKGTPACAYVRSAQCLCYSLSVINTLVNVNAPVVATTSWWLHFTATVVAKKGKKIYTC